MAQYSVNNIQSATQQAMAAAAKTIIGISAATATLRRAFLYDFEFGIDGAPASFTDTSLVWEWLRQSTLGTGTNAVPSPMDSADQAAGSVGTINHTAEPTAGVSLMAVGLNIRNSQRWIARDDKSRLVVPAVNLNGIGLRAKSAVYTSTVVATAMFDE